MRLIITDANIFIDIHAGALLEEMFRLHDIEFAVPDILYIEELADQHGRLPGLGLRVLTLSGETVNNAQNFKLRYKGTSQNDLFALALACEQHCPLLSGDGALRRAAESEGIEVHGTLWLIERMLEQEIVTADQAEEAYRQMKADGSRLPWEETQRQLQRWRRR